MLKTWTEPLSKPHRDIERRDLRRACRVCNGLTRAIVREDKIRILRWKKLHAKYYGYSLVDINIKEE